jgi:RNA polymerase sigma-54 factor
MKQSLQLKLGQQLTMTPQLQQAIRLLQLSSMELELEVQQVLESNMLLELDEEDDREPVDFNSEGASPATASDSGDYEAEREVGGGDEDFGVPSGAEDIPEDLPVDSDWDEIFDNTLAASGPAGPSEDAGGEFDNIRSGSGSLREHLLWQVNLLQLTDTDRAIAVAIVDAINQDGYLEAPLEEIRDAVNAEESLDDAVDLDEVGTVLKLVQALEPAGVGARDLRECLLLQFRQLPADTPLLATAQRLCEEWLDALAAREFALIMRRLKIDQDTLKRVIALIQSLNPRPGSQFGDEQPEYLVPDVFVRKLRGRWKVELNPDAVPHVRINPYYAGMIRRGDSSPANSSLKSHLQEARWFIKSLQSRSETLLKVATAIVERQKAFLDYGDEAMKPLVLHDIAEALGMHESTISRVTSRKYMHTPRGIYELKYFFSSHVSTSMGGEASSTAIRAVIRKLIAAEHTEKPLSDSKIANILSKQGINVARRTVAKYREAMQIPPSNERKRLA